MNGRFAIYFGNIIRCKLTLEISSWKYALSSTLLVWPGPVIRDFWNIGSHQHLSTSAIITMALTRPESVVEQVLNPIIGVGPQSVKPYENLRLVLSSTFLVLLSNYPTTTTTKTSNDSRFVNDNINTRRPSK